jgi:hypothetical protein
MCALAIALSLFTTAEPSAAQDGGTPTLVPGVGFKAAPAPASIRASVPLIYSAPAPSDVQKELVGPYHLLRSGSVDLDRATVTLPLYRGQLPGGEAIWYILTDTDDAQMADALGINFSAKLAYADVGSAVRPAHLETDGSVTFERGRVDFSLQWSLTPGDAPNPFPPTAFQPGSVGDDDYSPLAKIDGVIYNAPMVAFGVDASALDFCDGSPDYSLVHDRVAAICPDKGTVTLSLTAGFSFARPVLYLSTEANDPMPATMEGATYAPSLLDISAGRADSPFSAVERIFVFTNGPTGSDNPQRQGFNSALSHEGSPLNVVGGIPTVSTEYSPLWNLVVGEWTQQAIDLGYRSRLTEEFAILGFVQQGWITGPGGAPYGPSNLIVNCPIVWRFL